VNTFATGSFGNASPISRHVFTASSQRSARHAASASTIVNGGTISHLRLEHVWVEAWVPLAPSRAARSGGEAAWAPFDPPFKLHEKTPGLNLRAEAPLDFQQLVDQSTSTSTVNEAEGWFRNINVDAMPVTLGNYKSQIKAFITSRATNFTINQVLGGLEIRPKDVQVDLTKHTEAIRECRRGANR